MAIDSRRYKFDYLIKLLMIGDSGVGKTSLLMRFSDDTFIPSFITTIGIDFKIKTIHVGNKVVKLQIWDTAGQERFRTITSAYYKGSHGIILMFDLNDPVSFEHLKYWMGEIDKNSVCSPTCLLVGNKADLPKNVSSLEAKQFASQYNVKYFETSAKTEGGGNPPIAPLAPIAPITPLSIQPIVSPNEIFYSLAENIIQKINQQQLQTNITLTPHERKISCCQT